jgi:hypothetical protein
VVNNPLGSTKAAGNNTNVILIGVCVAMVSALVLYLQLAPKPAPQEIALTPDAKAYIANLGLADVGMEAKLDYFGQKVLEIHGAITNNGMRNLKVVEVTCVFLDYGNNTLLRQRSAIVSTKMGGLKPGEMKTFRLPFDNVPSAWNQQMPRLVIAGIDFE